MAAGYTVGVHNASTGNITIARATGADTINGSAKNLALGAQQRAQFRVNAAATGYLMENANPLLTDSTDASKQVVWDLSGITTGTRRTLALPDSSGTVLTTASAASSGASLVLIATASASASATVDFTSGITSTYDEYLVTITDVIPQTDNTQLNLRVSQSASFKSGAGNYSWSSTQVDSSATPTDRGGAAATEIEVGFSLSNTTTRSYCGEVRFWNPAGTAKNKLFRSSYSSIPSSGASTIASGGGAFILNATAIDGIRFLMSSGNITSGNFALYGVRKV